MTPVKGKGRIGILVPAYYLISNWDFSKSKKVQKRLVDLTGWLSIKIPTLNRRFPHNNPS